MNESEIKTTNEDRNEFLMRMYDQLFNDINTHILVVWQSVGVLIGAFAVFALVEKKIITIDIASTLIILICGWLIANVIDSGYWYNRNLLMITNIERQFLNKEDLRNIHYYFGKHRANKMIMHLQIQLFLGVGVALAVLLFQFVSGILPGLPDNFAELAQIFLPYLFVVLEIIYLSRIKLDTDKKYKEFLKNSPGIDIDTKGIQYGIGHGYPSQKS